jgi:hypothetical protein
MWSTLVLLAVATPLNTLCTAAWSITPAKVAYISIFWGGGSDELSDHGPSGCARLKHMAEKLLSNQRRCKQCKVVKDRKMDFLQTWKRGHDNVFCNDCARENMRKWARTPTSRLTDFAIIKDAGD